MKIYNSLTREKEEFVPHSKIKIYVCGPTVYDEPHIGHVRSAYVFDVVRRYLAYKYKDIGVMFVRNVTDVDDKIIDKARKEFSGEDLNKAVQKVADKYLKIYHRAMDDIGIMRPDKEPKATEYVASKDGLGKIQNFIKKLIDNNAAYVSGGDVYFDIKKAKNYGKLSNQNLEKMEIGARIAPGENKKDPLDFALWKAAKEGEPSWNSPWGQGRPGWHIECSVMSSDILGDEFDIHGGGLDLIFPHHENEIAQSEACGMKFAKIWMHNGLLTIRGEKMSKSLRNFVTVKDALKDLPDNNATDILKVFFLRAHYRKPMDFSDEAIKDAREAVHRLLEPLSREPHIENVKDIENKDDKKYIDDHKRIFENHMDNDFNTPQALATVFGLVRHCNHLFGAEKKDQIAIQYTINMIKKLCGVLGLSLNKINPLDLKWGDLSNINSIKKILKNKHWIKSKVEERNKAREQKNFKKADEIRKELFDKGIILEDAKEGKTEWRPKF